jgi:hypothetical protein
MLKKTGKGKRESLERQIRELGLAIIYAGDVVTAASNTVQSSLERGFARSAIGHASYVIDPNRSLLLDLAVRQNGRGSVIRPKYSQAYGQHSRLTVGYALAARVQRRFSWPVSPEFLRYRGISI